MKLTEAQLRSRVRREILSSMGDSAPVVYEGFLSDTWATLKSGAAAAAEKIAPLAKQSKEVVKSVIDDAMDKVDADSAAMKKLEETGSPDAWALYKAVSSFGTDEDAVRKVLEKRAGDLKVLSKEWSELTFKLNEIGLDTKEAVKEVTSGAAVGAAGGVTIAATLGAAATIAGFLGLAGPVTLASVLGWMGTGATAGVSAGAAIEGLDELKKWAEMKIDPSKTLAEVLADEGMDEEAQRVSMALREGVRKIRMTRRQLKRVVLEAIDVVDRDTGEVMRFSDDSSDSMADLPEKAWPDLAKRLGLSPKDVGLDAAGNQGFELDQKDFMRLDNETREKTYNRKMKKQAAAYAAERERLNPERLKDELRTWAREAAQEWQADNPQGPSVEDVAFDLADSAQYAFEPDEWEELLYHFDDDKEQLRAFTMDSMG